MTTPPRYRPRCIHLLDGRKVTIRAIVEADAPEIVQAFERLSDASRYFRFMRHKKQLEPAATPVFRDGDRELARPRTRFIRAYVLRGTHDVDAVGRRDRGHEREIAPGTRVHAAFEGGGIELLLVPHEAGVARSG